MRFRMKKIAKNIIIDVGHNPLAAQVICDELSKKNKKIILIYNSYKDKDYKEVLKVLKPVIKELHIISCDDNRMVQKLIIRSKKQKYFIDARF